MSEYFEVDTAKVRKAAREVQRIAETVRALAENQVKQMRTTVQDNLEGKAADALASELADLSGDIQKIAGALNTVQSTLRAYAAAVEEADRQSAANMKS